MLTIYGVTMPYEEPTNFFTTEKKAQDFIDNKIAKLNEFNWKHNTNYTHANDLYIVEIEVL